MRSAPPPPPTAKPLPEDLAETVDWRYEAALQEERLARMTDADLLALLRSQVAGYPVEVLEMLRRFESIRNRRTVR